jgi:hypothetical protein
MSVCSARFSRWDTKVDDLVAYGQYEANNVELIPESDCRDLRRWPWLIRRRAVGAHGGICRSVWLYHHFALSPRAVKKLNTQQGIQVSYKAWVTGCPKFRTRARRTALFTHR